MGNTEVKESHYYPVLGASIVSHKNVENNKYTLYVIQVTTQSGKWIVQRRYAEFRKFHEELSKRFSNFDFPPIPEKKIWGNMEADFIQNRKEKLNQYLTTLFSTAPQNIFSSTEFLMFFDSYNPTFIEKFDEFQQQPILTNPRSNSVTSLVGSSLSSSYAAVPFTHPSSLVSCDGLSASLPPTPSIYNHPSIYYQNQTRSELEYTQLYSWLESIDMGVFVQAFISNGFTLDLLKYYGITEFHLNNMEIMDPSHRARIMTEVSKLRQETFVSLGLVDTSTPTGAAPEDETKFCVICFEGYKEALLAPCGHICCCMECATSLENKRSACPVCRKSIIAVYKAFVV